MTSRYEIGDTAKGVTVGKVIDVYNSKVLIKGSDGDARWFPADELTLMVKKALVVGDKVTPQNIASAVKGTVVRGCSGWVAKKTNNISIKPWEITGSDMKFADADVALIDVFVIYVPEGK